MELGRRAGWRDKAIGEEFGNSGSVGRRNSGGMLGNGIREGLVL